jgi:hypothetical protein
MHTNSQPLGRLGQAVAVLLAGVLWLACDDESAASEPSVATPPESEALDAGGGGAEGRGDTPLPSEAPSSARGRVDAGTAEADAGRGLTPADAGGLPPGNDCCTESELPGCSNGSVLECVCAGDAACCNESYDALCVTEAITRCALACEMPPPSSDCSTPSEAPSCTVPEIAECVCAIDPFCCTFRFDANCVTLAAAECTGAQPSGQGAQP